MGLLGLGPFGPGPLHRPTSPHRPTPRMRLRLLRLQFHEFHHTVYVLQGVSLLVFAKIEITHKLLAHLLKIPTFRDHPIFCTAFPSASVTHHSLTHVHGWLPPFGPANGCLGRNGSTLLHKKHLIFYIWMHVSLLTHLATKECTDHVDERMDLTELNICAPRPSQSTHPNDHGTVGFGTKKIFAKGVTRGAMRSPRHKQKNTDRRFRRHGLPPIPPPVSHAPRRRDKAGRRGPHDSSSRPVP